MAYTADVNRSRGPVEEPYRHAKDKEEFDAFMAQHKQRLTPPNDRPQQGWALKAELQLPIQASGDVPP